MLWALVLGGGGDPHHQNFQSELRIVRFAYKIKEFLKELGDIWNQTLQLVQNGS